MYFLDLWDNCGSFVAYNINSYLICMDCLPNIGIETDCTYPSSWQEYVQNVCLPYAKKHFVKEKSTRKIFLLFAFAVLKSGRKYVKMLKGA